MMQNEIIKDNFQEEVNSGYQIDSINQQISEHNL